MKSAEVVRGSGNVFRDFGHASADVEQLKAVLAAEIIKMLDREGLTVRALMRERELRRRTFRGFGMRTWEGLRWIG